MTTLPHGLSLLLTLPMMAATQMAAGLCGEKQVRGEL